MTKKSENAHTPKQLFDELQSLVSEAQTLLADSATEHSQATLEALRERLISAQQKIAENYELARDKVVAGAKATDTCIRENPYQSIAIAAGVGILLGVLLGRRGSA